MNYFVFFKAILVCVFFSLKVFSLEVSVPINIYPPLSKTISMPVVGSSNTVIESNELDKYQNLPIHDILNMETGINSRSIYGTNSSGNKTTIDIRGMGAQAKSNVLILINGQRLNNIDMSEIDFPSIPSESIDRVEIIKGNAASVLYGDGAIGGAINIITNPELNKKNINEIILRTGTFNKREIVWKNYTKLENYSFSTIFNHDETDGYRDENEQQQNNFTSEIRYPGSLGQHLMVFNYSEQIMSTPSDRDQDQLYSDRRGSDTPDDYINSEGISLLYSSDYKLKDYTDFIFNSSFRLKNSFSDLQSSSFPSYNDTALTNYQITPRINQKTNILGKIVSSIYGLDLLYADYKSYRKQDENAIPLHVYDARQSSYSAYLQQSIYLSNFSTLGIGFRFQRNYIEIGDHLERNAPDYAGWQTEHKTLSDQETNYAINLGMDHKINKNIKAYGRLGSGFRYPNIDDRIGGSGGTSLHLNTQKTNDLELGTEFSYNNFFSNISGFIIDGENEIAYDTDAFENINMNSTRRYGLEIKTVNNVFEKIKLKNNLTFIKAKYTSGDQGTYATDFEGNDVPLVPNITFDTSMELQIFDNTTFMPSIKYQDDMRMESDDENFQDTKIPSHVLLNLSIQSELNGFYSDLSINNILNENYHNYAVASSSTLGSYNTYPEPGREIIFSIGKKF